MRRHNSVVFRSTYVRSGGVRSFSSRIGENIDALSEVPHAHAEQAEEVNSNSNGQDDFDDNDDGYREMITLPHSTHSFLFTEDVFSVPFALAASVVIVSISCLVLALWDNLEGGTPGNLLSVPANVNSSVRAAQYFSALIALTMEEEIPTATYLLRMIPKTSVENKLNVSYAKFVLSALIRLSIGYLFLLNTYIVIVQSERVLDMFYDMLALQFVSLMDDIVFKLAKYDIMGKRLRIATSAKCFRTEFGVGAYRSRKKMTVFMKFLYIFNFVLFAAGIITISASQSAGYYQCKSITASLGEEVWERAWTRQSDDQSYDSMVLVYSHFNGIYKQTGTHARRPVYTEMRKSEDSPFETHIGAEIKYCKDEKAWIFTHENITKSNVVTESGDDRCQWLLRSPDTEAYDLMDVSGEWSIWVGKINHGAEMSVTCNECKDNKGALASSVDCNFNGQCNDEKRCSCDEEAGYVGVHCELEKPCPRLIGKYNESWSLVYSRDCDHVREYDRPVYTLEKVGDTYDIQNDMLVAKKDDIVVLVYAGSRWLVKKIEGGRKLDIDAIEKSALQYHAFWDAVHDNETLAVSDPTSRSFPVGVDFYKIGERGEEYGPIGVLYPLNEPPGRGLFRCDHNATDSYAGYKSVYTYCNTN